MLDFCVASGLQRDTRNKGSDSAKTETRELATVSLLALLALSGSSAAAACRCHSCSY
jgi:hypothetical protein